MVLLFRRSVYSDTQFLMLLVITDTFVLQGGVSVSSFPSRNR